MTEGRMVDVTNRPSPPAPLDLLSEASREAWRDYMLECGLADNPSPLVRNSRPGPTRPRKDDDD